MSSSWKALHEHTDINGYLTHTTALFPEHVRAGHTQECTSPTNRLDGGSQEFTAHGEIPADDYRRVLVSWRTKQLITLIAYVGTGPILVSRLLELSQPKCHAIRIMPNIRHVCRFAFKMSKQNIWKNTRLEISTYGYRSKLSNFSTNERQHSTHNTTSCSNTK
jgi:hypothetical protein